MKKRGSLVRMVLAPLYELGNTSNKIAKSLEKKGVKGKVGNLTSCPLANVLRKEYKGESITVDKSTITINGVTVNIEKTPFAEFVTKFDQNVYPNLEK